jgi:hypothetical protein
MSEDRTTTGERDRGPGTRTGATAMADPRGEAQTPPTAEAGEAARPAGRPSEQQATQPVPAPAPQPQPRDDTERPTGTEAPGGHPTAPVSARTRPRPRQARRAPLIRMGPWAPVAGATVGLLLGVVVVLLLLPAVSAFAERLSLVFVVLGLSLLGAGGTLLADEVRLLRRGTQAVEARSASAGVIAGLLNGLTPARLLITVSAFCLLLSAYVTTRG